MNLDKKLAKYAKQIDNPKYYGKILDILDKADKKGYEFKDFNEYDLLHITTTIASYYDVVKTEEDDKAMIFYTNKQWFIVNDRNIILYETSLFRYAIIFYIKSSYMLLIERIKALFNPAPVDEDEFINKHIRLIKGAARKTMKLNLYNK